MLAVTLLVVAVNVAVKSAITDCVDSRSTFTRLAQKMLVPPVVPVASFGKYATGSLRHMKSSAAICIPIDRFT